jgi:type III restriction enzyme
MSPKKRTKKRLQKVKQINLSEYSFKINTKKCNFNEFRFSDIEEYVEAIAGARQYEYDAIKEIMIYLWGGGYNSIEELAKENFNRGHINKRFASEEIFLNHLPLRDRLSGVVHMATGTGKSFVIWAVAYLSIVMGLTKRVLVLAPPQTVIRDGLQDKFIKLLRDEKLNKLLPLEYQGKPVDIVSDKDVIEDYNIIIKNFYSKSGLGSIEDTLFSPGEEVLVLSDEVHHPYAHLTYAEGQIDLEDKTKKDEENERQWMQFLREHEQIKRHIGFTGTPYNKDDFFADVIFNYSIAAAKEEQVIKNIEAIIDTQTEEGTLDWSDDNRFQLVYKKHKENSEKFSYSIGKKRMVKPITIFICSTQISAGKWRDKFVDFLIKTKEDGLTGSEAEQSARQKTLLAISSEKSVYESILKQVESTDIKTQGGMVEYIFTVNSLSEGWDADNVFQIVPMEEKAFNSKLLISQVLGRGLRVPREVPAMMIKSNYPVVTVTNHEKFGEHIKELLSAVVNSDLSISSEVISSNKGRGIHHFNIFNLNYLASPVVEEEIKKYEQTLPSNLILEKGGETQDVKITFIESGQKTITLQREIYTLSKVVADIYRRFKNRNIEGSQFDFSDSTPPIIITEEEIRNTIERAMIEAGIKGKKVTDANKKRIELFFNRFLPAGTKKRRFENIKGNLEPISTKTIERSGVRIGELERDGVVFVSEDYETELDRLSIDVIGHIKKDRENINKPEQQLLGFVDPKKLLGQYSEYVRTLVLNDLRPPFIVNSSVLKNPQSSVIVTHSPEKEFVFRLISSYEYIESWIKSPDKGFYSIGYIYWKKGKDKTMRGFNPDFFIKQDLQEYIKICEKKGKDTFSLKQLEKKGYTQLIRVVEIKSEGAEEESINKAKNKDAIEHFEGLNKKLIEQNASDIEEQYREDLKQFYTFDLLTPDDYERWFNNLSNASIKLSENMREMLLS